MSFVESSTPSPSAARNRNPRAVATRTDALHLVQFYENDDTLYNVVCDFLGAGILGGEQIIVIATEQHRRGFIDRLISQGVDVAAASGSGQIKLLDAHETLEKFMVDAMPNRERFNATIEATLGAARLHGSQTQIRAYGEMVDILWRAGNPQAALRLEELWNDLQDRYSFSLLCAYAMANFYKEPGGMQRVCATHTHVVEDELKQRGTGENGEATNDADSNAASLSAEIDQRRKVEAALRVTLRDLRDSQQQLQAITDALPALVSYISAEERYQFVNQSYQRWFGTPSGDLVGKSIREVLGDCAYEVVAERVKSVLAGESVTFQDSMPYALGGTRYIEGMYIPHRDSSNQVQGFVALINDISERKQAEMLRGEASSRSERLRRITSAIADAVSTTDVYKAVVDSVAAALDASSAGLFVCRDDGTVELVRSIGYDDAARPHLLTLRLDAEPSIPVLDAIRSGEPMWIDSQEALIEQYPHLASIVSAGRSYSIGCLPIRLQNTAFACLAFTFDGKAGLESEQRHFLTLVSRYAGQALERLRLLELEKKSRAEAETSAAKMELLYSLAAAVNAASNVDAVFNAALESVQSALGALRCSILVSDEDGVMRFRAWRGLSDGYRKAVDGHSPWTKDAAAPVPIIVADAASDPAMAPYREIFAKEGIAALGFIPLVADGRLIGKFMVYYDTPRNVTEQELELALAISHHVAAAIARFSAADELRETVHFNEMFAGILGHDLRNPLHAIMAAAQLAQMRAGTESDKLTKPLGRIINSGNRMSRMIDQLLDFTRVRVGGGIGIETRAFDLAVVVQQLVDELESANPEWNFDVTAAGNTHGVWDSDRLSQVFSNLIGNAVRHGLAENGATLKLDGTLPHTVSVEVRNMGTIPAALLPRIFEPMTGSDSGREKSHGLGLGLYITRELVTAHGGSITVRSSDADGTAFTVALPRVVLAEGVRRA